MIALRLEKLLPRPLKERLEQRPSGLWQQSLHWDTPQRIFVQAPSGAGKTTLIHLLYGLRRDTEGAVFWGGKSWAEMKRDTPAAMRRQELSIVFQDLRLFPGLTVWENLEIKRALTNSVQEDEVHSMLDRLGMAAFAKRLAGSLSYGEQQRVAIIRALLQPFHWLLLDEPFSHLDEANKRRAAALIESVVARNQASLFLAELDENEYFPYSERIVL